MGLLEDELTGLSYKDASPDVIADDANSRPGSFLDAGCDINADYRSNEGDDFVVKDIEDENLLDEESPADKVPNEKKSVLVVESVT